MKKMIETPQELIDLQLVSIRQFKEVLGVGTNKFYQLKNTDKNFPQPVALGKRPMYRLVEIKAYMAILPPAPANMGRYTYV